LTGICNNVNGFNRCAATLGCHCIERSGTYRDDFHAVGGLHRGDGVARIDGALEGISGLNGNNVGNLGDVKLGSHTRCHVLAGSRCGEQDVAVVSSHCQHLSGNVFRQAVLKRSTIGQDHFGNTGDFGGLLSHGVGTVACHQDMDVTTNGCCGGYRAQRRSLELGVVVFSNNQIRHDQTTFASFLSLSTSVATSGTMMPALRAAGSTTFSVLRRGATSTPRSSGETVSSGFFLAFMMLGSVT